MAEPFSERLRNKANDIWQAQHCHPFVRGIADGTLSLERFKFWVRQDYVFLIDYARLLALAVARSPDLPTMTRFAKLVTATLDTEMSLHRAYAAEFGISSEELEGELPHRRPGPTRIFCCGSQRWAILPDSWRLCYPACGDSLKSVGAWPASLAPPPALRQVDRHVRLGGIRRVSRVVPGLARSSMRTPPRVRPAEGRGCVSDQ